MIIYGKNPVKELLADPRSRIDEIIVAKDSKKDGDPEIFALAKKRGVRVQLLPKDAVTRLTGTASHQGVAARVPGGSTLPSATLSRRRARSSKSCSSSYSTIWKTLKISELS
ncbi:MAG: RNA methyltransferase substrate-binding domain-containing protein [Thermodesulfobacteriota bacterium]